MSNALKQIFNPTFTVAPNVAVRAEDVGAIWLSVGHFITESCFITEVRFVFDDLEVFGRFAKDTFSAFEALEAKEPVTNVL